MSNNQIVDRGQRTSNQSVLGTEEASKKGFSPCVKRFGRIIAHTAQGVLNGYSVYQIIYLIHSLGGLKGKNRVHLHPFPYVLSGIAGALIAETASLIYDLALKVMGERREYEDLTSGQISLGDRLRKHTWKVVKCVENVHDKIDAVFSHCLGIRSAKEIREQKIADKDLYFLEISRRAFWEQIRESLPKQLGMGLVVKACGYTLLGGHVFIALNTLSFLFGLTSKIWKVYAKIHQEKKESGEEPEENLFSCDLTSIILGNRQDYEKLDETQASSSDLFRKRVWKVIIFFENIHHRIDAIFSRCIGIRTMKEIHDRKIADKDLSFFEISRRAFFEKIPESLPERSLIYGLEAIGHPIVVTYLWLDGITFLSEVIGKISDTYKKIREEEAGLAAA